MKCSKCGATLTSSSGFCPSCGQPIVGFAVGQAVTQSVPGVAPAQVPAYSAAPVPAAAAQAGVGYAGFWLRVVAAIIDGIIISIPLAPIFFMMFIPMFRNPQSLQNMQDPTAVMRIFGPMLGLLVLVSIVASWLYWALCESSSWQATLGKKILGLYVTDTDGNRASFGRTSGRFFAGRGVGTIPYLGGNYLFVDCICVAFTGRKQAIHDMIAGCLVLRRL
jgi:uncharacterized RDD family membrane protein YckC